MTRGQDSGVGGQGITEVVAAVLTRPDGEVLLAARPEGKVYAGYWEFPGGKVEAGESLQAALARELKEELGIEGIRATRWITKVFTYPHATVRLNFFRVWDWDGEPHPHEGQTFAWLNLTSDNPAHHSVEPLLPANFPILKALQLPPVYGISYAKSLGREVFLQRLDAALDKGLKLIQIRDKELPEAERLELAREVVKHAKPHAAHVLVNGTLELARAAGAHGVHLDSGALMNLESRPDCKWVGASCHHAAELAHAASIADFAMLSPVLPTASHPGEPSLGWAAFAQLAAQSPIPVYALGGVNWPDVDTAREHGAHGIAMLRGAWH